MSAAIAATRRASRTNGCPGGARQHGASPPYPGRVLRYLTAGESHGRALVVIVEGLPAGLPVTAEQIQSELARRRLGYGRGPAPTLRGRRADPGRRHPPRPHARLAGGDRDRQLRVGAQRQVARGDVAGAGCDEVAADTGASGARRPGRDAEVRLRRRARRAGASERPRDGGPRRRRCRWPSCCSPSSASRSSATSCSSARRGRPSACGRSRRPGGDRRRARCAASTGRGECGDGRGDQGRSPRRRLARRRRRGARPTACRSASAAMCTGTARSTRCSPRR